MRDEDPLPADILKQWVASGAARRWVLERNGRWNHDDWMLLLHQMQRRGPIDPKELGDILEEFKREPDNLRRWVVSGDPARWVAAHHGIWHHGDWLQLLDELGQSTYWPMQPADIGQVLEETRINWLKLQHWIESEQPRRWVELHHGQWNHHDWLNLLRDLEQFTGTKADSTILGVVLEQHQLRYWNLRRWVLSGGPRLWVEVRQGSWSHADWLMLLYTLRQTIGELDEVAVGLALEEARRRYWHLQRWLDTGEARLWVEMHRGQWNHAEWQGLLEHLERSGWSPLDPQAVGEALESLKTHYWNLHRWQQTSQPRLRLVTQGIERRQPERVIVFREMAA